MQTRNMKFKIDHIMIRVSNLENSLHFYTNILGMKVLRSRDYPDGKFTNVFIGYGDENKETALELTYNWEQNEPYEKGSAYGHIALVVDNLIETVSYLQNEGVRIKTGPKKMNYGTRLLAFILDPDDYLIEIIEPINADIAN